MSTIAFFHYGFPVIGSVLLAILLKLRPWNMLKGMGAGIATGMLLASLADTTLRVGMESFGLAFLCFVITLVVAVEVLDQCKRGSQNL